MTYSNAQRGYLVVLTLIFGSVFFVMLVAFMGFVVTQKEGQHAARAGEEALAIAEAGLNYYKWFLAHNPDDLTNGTGEAGPYVMEYHDPEGGVIGEYSISVEGDLSCGSVSSVEITSTGRTTEEPSIERTIYARYSRPTVAEFAYIINSNVWAGPDRTIVGPYHANGIIRMDGTNNSIVSSGQESWACDDNELPCDPHDDGDTVDAVYGDGDGSDLWVFPRPPIDFGGITVDLAAMKSTAENAGGIYLPPSEEFGYRIHINGDGTIGVYVVDDVYTYWGKTGDNVWEEESHVIDDDDFVATYTIPESCSLVYVEDKVWLEGDVAGKVTIVAADVDATGGDPHMILNDNITYVDDDAGLLAIAEQDVLIGLAVPDDMELNGIFIAQQGRFGRNHYCDSCFEVEGWWWQSRGLPWYLDEYEKRDTLTVNGTIVSNGRVGTQWVSGGGTFSSGFETRYNSYDRDLVTSPPPMAPATSDMYQFIEWREME